MEMMTFFDVCYLHCLAAPCVLYCISLIFYRKAKQTHSGAALKSGFLFKRIAVCGMLFLNVISTCLSIIFPISNYIEPSDAGLGMIFSFPAVCFFGVGFFVRGNLGRNFRAVGCALFALNSFGLWRTTILDLLLVAIWILVFLSCFIKKEKRGILIATICCVALSFIWGIIINITMAIQMEASVYYLISWCVSLLLQCAASFIIVRMNQREFEEDFLKRVFFPKPIAEKQEEVLEDGGEITLGPTGQPVQVDTQTEENRYDIFSGGGRIYRGLDENEDE